MWKKILMGIKIGYQGNFVAAPRQPGSKPDRKTKGVDTWNGATRPDISIRPTFQNIKTACEYRLHGP
jgi:hypothetical protein